MVSKGFLWQWERSLYIYHFPISPHSCLGQTWPRENDKSLWLTPLPSPVFNRLQGLPGLIIVQTSPTSRSSPATRARDPLYPISKTPSAPLRALNSTPKSIHSRATSPHHSKLNTCHTDLLIFPQKLAPTFLRVFFQLSHLWFSIALPLF